MDDKDDDLFPAASTEAEDAEPETVEQPEAEPEEQPAQEAPVEPDPEKMVPLAALQSARDENKGLKARLSNFEAQMAQLQQQQPRQPIDVNAPDLVPMLAQAFDGRVTNQKLEMSRFLAERDFGADTVAEAYAYFDEHPQESAALLKEVSPFHAAVEYYKRMKAAKEIGSDPDAYRARIEAEIRQKILAEQATESVKQPSRGPSLASQPNLGSRQGQEWSGPTPLDDILKG